MGWSYRKSFGSGPFRINLSKGGVGYSVGVKGARVNVGPRGTFVNLSSHGVTYRKKIGSAAKPIPLSAPVSAGNVQTINSAGIGQLSDADSKDFIVELTQKASQVSYVTWLGIVPLVIYF